MKTTRMKSLTLTILFCVFCLALKVSQAENLALGRAVRLEPSPNYPLCASDTDDRELTDGEFCPHDIQIWCQPQCVGWQAIPGTIRITVDFGRAQEFDRVRLYTAAGAGDVRLPSLIDVEVSLDGDDFRTLGSLTAGNINPLPQGDEYQKMVYEAEFPAVAARYARLRILPAGSYFFAEEIEIERSGQVSPVNLASLVPVVDDKTLSSQLEGNLPGQLLRQRLEKDWALVSSRLKEIPEPSPALLTMQQQLFNAIRTADFRALGPDFRTVVPMHPLQAELLAWHGALLQAMGYAPVTIWTQDRFSPLSPYAIPPSHQSLTKLDAYLMNGEKRGAVLQFTNATQTELQVALQAEDLPGEIFYAEFVDSNELKTNAVALVPLTGPVAVQPGLTRQFYLRLAPQNCAPGRHQIPLRFTLGDGEEAEITLNMQIAKVNFPEQTTLSSGWWDYLNFTENRSKIWSLTSAHLSQALALEQSMGVDTTFGDAGLGQVCWLADTPIDAEGNLDCPPDFANFDRWAAQWPEARNYVIYLALNPESTFGGAVPGTPRFNQAVAQWARRWEEHLLESGISPERVIFQLLDEPRDDLTWDRTRTWSEAIRQGSSRLTLFTNPLNFPEGSLEILEKYDIICPNTLQVLAPSAAQSAFFRRHVAAGKRLWLYTCQAGPFNTSPWYYRRQAWQAFRLGATGSFFWSLGDTGGVDNGWNQYLVKGIYFSPLIIDGSSLTTTKHWEAAAEALADYEYLVILRNSLPEGGLPPQYSALLDELIPQVLQSWDDPEGCRKAEKARLKILAAIDELNN